MLVVPFMVEGQGELLVQVNNPNNPYRNPSYQPTYLGRPLKYLIFSLMALIRGPIS